jgi:hypothetical protein
VCNSQISCPLWSLSLVALCTGADECKKLERLIKKKKKLVDVAPHWGEPRISCVLMCFVRCDLCCFVVVMYNEYT